MKFIHLSPIRKDVSGISEADQLVEHLVVLEGEHCRGRHQLDSVKDELAQGAKQVSTNCIFKACVSYAGLLSSLRNSGSTLTAIS